MNQTAIIYGMLDDIVRQKLKIQKVANELDDTFDDMMVNY